MKAVAMFMDCPAYMDNSGSVRCGLPAEVEGRSTMRSTDGPLESVRIQCPRGHWFNGPIEFLTVPRQSRSGDGADSRQRGNPPAVADRAVSEAGLPARVDHDGLSGGGWRVAAS